MLKPYLAQAMNRENLSAQQAEEAMQVIMTGQATEAQVGGYLVAMRMKGETVEEIAGSARAMRDHAARIPFSSNGHDLLDTAGTGGDGAHTFNISTTAAFILAGAGRLVAKHGNKAASSRSGSADVLAESGVNLDLTPDQVAECLEEIGIGFLFAPRFHPAMKYAIGPRRELGLRTIFNLLGPLTNPAGATHQLIGVYDPNLTELLARVIGELGVKAAYVVHGAGGIDELSTSGENQVSEFRGGEVRTFILDGGDFDLNPGSVGDLRGGSPEENAVIMRQILAGHENGSRRDVVLLNAGVALATQHGDIQKGIEEARESLVSGAALDKLEQLAAYSQKLA